MTWKNTKLIFLREVRDQVRDRRTLFMIAVLPLLLYPAMGLGIVQMNAVFFEQPRTVVILGAEHLPRKPELQLLDGNGFVRNYFRIPSDAEKLHVVTDLAPPGGEKGIVERDSDEAELLAQAEKIREKLDRHRRLEEREDAAAAEQLARINHELSRLLAESRVQVLIIIPDDFAASIERVNRQLAEGTVEPGQVAKVPRPVIVQNTADEKSQIAYDRVAEVLESWKAAILRDRLRKANLPEHFSTPVSTEVVDVAEKSQLSANIWARLLPGLLVIMAVTGAFYPAVDLAAGEKERGTMETLLICPATRGEIVLGKFFTVMLFSMSTAVLNLVSMGITGKYLVSIAGSGALSKVGSLAPPSLLSIVWVVVLLLPLAALFSALSLALATFARSSKEGQYYLTPLLTVTIGLTIFCMAPGIEIRPLHSLMPIVGPTLLLKEMLKSNAGTAAMLYAIPVMISSVAYSLLALWWAVEQFAREEVLFREAERFDLRLWLRSLLREKEPTPTFSKAGFCFVLIMLVQFASLKPLSEALLASNSPTRILWLQTIYLVATVAAPALFMGILLTTSVVRTFRLRRPRWSMLGLAVALPLALHPLSVELLAGLEWLLDLQMPPGASRLLESMAAPDLPIWFVLLVFAAVPAVCEELAFRGFLLSGFSRSGRVWLAIVLSSVTFGIIHTIPQQVFNASLLGLALGLLAIRSGSLLPPIVFHFVYNALQVVRGRFGAEWLQDSRVADWFVTLDGAAGGEVVRYDWPTLVAAAVVAIVLIRWLVKQKQDGTQAAAAAPARHDGAQPQVATANFAEPAVAEQASVQTGG